MRLPRMILIFTALFGCQKKSDDPLYVDSNNLVMKTDLIELPGIVCIRDGNCKDYVARADNETMSLESFQSECKSGQLLEGKACVRNLYGCIKTSSNETAIGSYTSIDLKWGIKIDACHEPRNDDLTLASKP